jgi:hypothetical protein
MRKNTAVSRVSPYGQEGSPTGDLDPCRAARVAGGGPGGQAAEVDAARGDGNERGEEGTGEPAA